MSMPDTVDGLALERIGHGWRVVHAASGLAAHDGHLRQRRFAEQARTDLLATGADFTPENPREVTAQREQWRDVYRLWSRRADQHRIDHVTGEYYPQFTRYGQYIPSQEQAARIAEAMACFAWS